jgi:hypothetical protein
MKAEEPMISVKSILNQTIDASEAVKMHEKVIQKEKEI